MATIYDIAKKVGVNPSTVSRALRNEPGVNPDLKETIKRAAKEMNYRPNILARQLRQKEAFTIGLVLDEKWDWYTSSMTEGIQNGAQEHKMYVLVWNAEDFEAQKAGIRFFESYGISGVIIASMHLPEDEELHNSQLPIVYVNRMGNDTTTVVRSNESFGGYIAAKYLIVNGHRKIGCISGPQSWVDSKERLTGVKQALSEEGLELRQDWFFEGDWHEQCGYDIGKKLLSLKERPTAIMSGNDEMAAGVYDAAYEMGISIPDDLSIIGYNNHIISSYLRPRLTTVTLPLQDLGREAVGMLCEMIDKGLKTPSCQYIKPKLVIRDSVKAIKLIG